jgi:delta(3,5)-delta(2,4)-dienoyl-CoA isomerase
MSDYPRPYTAFGKVEYHTLTMEAYRVLRVSFKRGAVNAWIEPMWREFDRILRFIKYDGDVNAIVLSGENRCFTAGLDCEWCWMVDEFEAMLNLEIP